MEAFDMLRQGADCWDTMLAIDDDGIGPFLTGIEEMADSIAAEWGEALNASFVAGMGLGVCLQGELAKMLANPAAQLLAAILPSTEMDTTASLGVASCLAWRILNTGRTSR